MIYLDYFILREDSQWRIRFLTEDGPFTPYSRPYGSMLKALTAALEIARIDLHFGQDVRVLVQEPDGQFRTEWVGTGMVAEE